MYACRNLFFTETCFGWPTLFWSPRKTGLRFANNARRTACRGKWRSLQECETTWYLRTEIAPDEDYFAVASFKPSDDLPKAIPTILRVVCAWLTRYSMCGCLSRGLSPPTISDTSGLQVNFASIPDQAAPDLIEVGIIWSFPCFFLNWLQDLCADESGFGIKLLFDVGDDIDTVTATCRCITFCWNEFRKYANIVPCAIGVRGPGLAFLSLMCWTARRAWGKTKLQNRHKQMPRTRKWSVVWRDQHSQKKIFQKDVLRAVTMWWVATTFFVTIRT